MRIFASNFWQIWSNQQGFEIPLTPFPPQLAPRQNLPPHEQRRNIRKNNYCNWLCEMEKRLKLTENPSVFRISRLGTPSIPQVEQLICWNP